MILLVWELYTNIFAWCSSICAKDVIKKVYHQHVRCCRHKGIFQHSVASVFMLRSHTLSVACSLERNYFLGWVHHFSLCCHNHAISLQFSKCTYTTATKWYDMKISTMKIFMININIVSTSSLLLLLWAYP